MGLMSLVDAAFLVPETRDQPMHVGILQLFTTPEGAGRDYLADLYRVLLRVEDISPIFGKRAYRSLSTLGQWAWQSDPDVDLEHHVRHSALPRPGRIRELLALTSRLHSTLLDRQRPLWEMYLIEGLQDGRFAVYLKVHHALLDGVSGLRRMQKVLTPDPGEALRAPYAPIDEPTSPGYDVRRSAASVTTVLGEVIGLGGAAVHVAERLLREQAAALPVAPRTILNGPITGSRRFAAQSWPLDRLKAVATASRTSINDVVLAMCSAALRRYLLELAALPASSLIALVPVSLRGVDSVETAGNAVGSILCNLATDLDDPVARLTAIGESMGRGKQAFLGKGRLEILATSGLTLAPVAVGSLVGLHQLPLPFNVTISNVPGPRHTLYMGGARLDAFYPLSIPTVGQALNITVTSYLDQMQFGLTGCRRQVPHLQRLLIHLETAVDELEQALAVG